MLISLYIKNYALFKETRVDFPKGLNILTGETGAGKSLLVGALGLIMGKRADNSAIFFPDTKCVVEATFDHLAPHIKQELKGFEAFDLEDEEVILRREISPSGKSRAFVNDSPVPLPVAREVSSLLLDFHGQHENQSLLKGNQQLELLDAFAGTQGLVLEFREKLSKCTKLFNELQELEQREQQAKDQQEFIQFQLKELEAANLQGGEEEQLEQEINLLQNAEDIREFLTFSTEELYHQDQSVFNRLAEISSQLEKFAGLNIQLEENKDRLLQATELLRDAAFSLQGLQEEAESNPERLAFVEERLAVYHNLKLKYGFQDGAALIARYQELSNQAEDFDSLAERIQEVKQKLAKQLKKLTSKGLEIEAVRIEKKKDLEAEVDALLAEVGFKQAQFQIHLTRNVTSNGMLQIEEDLVKPALNGINQVQFMIRTNPGLPAGPLNQIASGGEISRVMLAIKAALADKSDFPVLIFDEIDTGISGEIANKVGLVMKKLAKRFQILSITHLPQIAAKGNEHFYIYKQVENDRTTSSVRQLSIEERIHEIAKMLSGENPPSSAVEHARELMEG